LKIVIIIYIIYYVYYDIIYIKLSLPKKKMELNLNRKKNLLKKFQKMGQWQYDSLTGTVRL
jgi:hypothetical protein